jgi:hypothetical protein
MAEPTYYVGVRESVAGANKRHIVLWNGHATVVVRVYNIRAAGAPTGTVTGTVVPLYVARLTSAPTNGTDVAFTPADSTNPNVPVTILCRANTTTGANEGGVISVGAVSGEETASLGGDDLFTSPIDGSQPLYLRPGEGIVVRQGTLASAGAISVSMRVGAA